MDTNFLNALKIKSDAVSASLKKDAPASKIEAKKPEYKITEVSVPGYTIDIGARLSGLEIIINRRRLDIYFDRKPNDAQRSLLTDFGFRCRKDVNDDDSIDYVWYHQNNEDNINFLKANFPTIAPDFWDTPKDPETVENEIADPLASSDETFREYVRKVNALSTHLKLDRADLTIKAIDCLYDVTFNS